VQKCLKLESYYSIHVVISVCFWLFHTSSCTSSGGLAVKRITSNDEIPGSSPGRSSFFSNFHLLIYAIPFRESIHDVDIQFLNCHT
jgi:hypothetical protein